MSVPNHREDCQTMLWWTRCPDCRVRVCFFSCTCGSRVFFEYPGHSWPLHSDRCIPQLYRQLRAEGHSVRQVRQLVEDESARRHAEIPAELANQLQADEFAETGEPTIAEVEPNGDGQVLTGQIISESRQVNFFKRLNYPDNAFSRAFLGKLVADHYVELRLRGAPDTMYGIAPEVTCFVPLKVYEARSLRVGAVVRINLVAHQLPNDARIWVVS